MLDFIGKVVLITGGTSGIGLAAAKQLVQQGASVMLAGRGADRDQDSVVRLVAVAAAILFLASDEAAWITGTSLLVDGGLTAR